MERLVTLVLIVAALVTVTTSCQGNVFDLEVGDCFQDPDAFAAEISDVEIVDCSGAHDNEVYHVFDLPDGGYPGTSAVVSASEDGCLDAFAGYVGIDYLSSRYSASSIHPSESSWNEGDDREVVCFLYDMDLAPLTGSARNTAQ